MVSSPHVVLLLSAIVACSCCPSDDWIPYTNGMCYRMVQIFAPWYTVDNICDYGTPGARAVSIHDLLQNAFLAETVANGTAAWLGLSRLAATSPWRWSDGSLYDFDNWWDGQPLGDCAFINYGKEGEWAAMDCDFSSAWFLCQIEEHHGTMDDAASVRRQMDQ
ncbi:Lectin BRA-3 [Amphibalanus amphitrite]|uniref:Lectin BRA-3 n=1 Tax=Amphibalanus amphitrite TaxID=1232801 RepID=A0A6A4WF66_AMPAM|nr:Lectin BRA-3 [Amphibalanus amphitrite]